MKLRYDADRVRRFLHNNAGSLDVVYDDIKVILDVAEAALRVDAMWQNPTRTVRESLFARLRERLYGHGKAGPACSA